MFIKNVFWLFLKWLSSLRFAISLFLLLALVSILGTIIEQDQVLDYYRLNYPDVDTGIFDITWKKIIFLGFNHIYSTYWFLGILLLFFLSLLLCTFSTQLPIFRHAKQWNFLYNQSSLEKKIGYFKFKDKSLMNFIYVLNTNNYYSFHKGMAIYAYKGLWAKLAPIFVHISIIVTFLGFVLGFTSGFMVQEMIPSGEIFHIQNVVKSGYLSSISYNFLGKINDFCMTFNRNKSIQQFFSDVSILDNQGKILINKTISVNSPLKFHGITLYQTDWQVNALRLQIGHQIYIVRSLKKINFQNNSSIYYWVCSLGLKDNHIISIIISDLNNNLSIYDEGGMLLKQVSYGQWNVIYGVPVIFIDVMYSTGLQIKTDPGIKLAYLGFLILMLSIIISYMSYSQVWINKNNYTLNFGGKTNRAFIYFEDEIVKIYKTYQYLCKFV